MVRVLDADNWLEKQILMKNDLVVAYLQHGSSSIILSQKINWNEKILKWVWEKLKANNWSAEN